MIFVVFVCLKIMENTNNFLKIDRVYKIFFLQINKRLFFIFHPPINNTRYFTK